jgi:hypothetical protein
VKKRIGFGKMDKYFLEALIDSNMDDILSFLERDNEVIRPYKHFSENSDDMNIIVNFHSRREGNKISIYAKVNITGPMKPFSRHYQAAPDGKDNEIISFEVTRLADAESLVKGGYQQGNSHIELIFFRSWVKLAIGFGAGFAGEALIRLRQLEQSVEQKGWS